MSRPLLNKHIKPDDFLSFYWLKEELIIFLREYHLPTTGSKQDLTARISQFLTTGSISSRSKHSKKIVKVEMPKTFTRQSIVEAGWRCSQELRVFFEQEIGKHFHLDGVMRGLIYDGSGKTLNQVIQIWEEEWRKPKKEKTIAAQFEYNRHIREYFKTHPQAKLQEAIKDWKTKKKQRRN
ncbi:MAG: SAP domain-containing protein [Anaerolineales bacterium]|nr:SAP domain-containing protein [Anaerolineales bacterium]